MKWRSRKPKVGYENNPPKIRKQRYNSWLSKLFVSPHNKVSLSEKVVKFLIYISLRLVIRPRKWKHPEKNYEIIDRTYQRIMSADFIYIPSSIAFYLIMAFMPIISLITLVYLIPGVSEWLSSIGGGSKDPLGDVLGKFIPGLRDVISQIRNAVQGASSIKVDTGAIVATLISLASSTWIAAGGFAKLVFTQSYIYDHKYVGGYWMNKIKGMAMVLSFTLALICVLTINIYFNTLIQKSDLLSNRMKSFFSHAFLAVGLFFGLFFGFILLYKFSPRYKIKIKHIIPGAMISTIPTAGFLILFGSITSIWSYGSYGTIGVFMYIGMSALIITYFVFVGIVANASYYKTFVGDKVQNKWTLSKK